jgi:hypothetical protein
MALTPQDIQNIVAELRKLNITTAERLEDEQATRDVLKDQVKQLQFQDSLKQDINKAASQIYNITTDLLYEEKRVLGTRQANLAIQKDLDKVTKSINTLEENKNVLLKAGGKLNTDIADSIDKQLLNAKKLQKELEDQQKTSKEINNNFGTGGFQFLSELTSKLGGRASKLAQPFEKMADASREVVQNETLRNKKIGEFQQVKGDLEKITRGELKVTKDIAKQYGLVNKEGKLLTGASGKSAAQSALKVGEGLGKSASKAKIMSKGLKAGFKSMGGIASKANVYLLIAMAIVKVVKFIVDLFIQANEQNVMISRNLGVSRDTAIQLREEFNIIAATTKNTFVNNKELLKVYYAQVEALGQMGGINKENLANAVFLEKNMGLTAETATKLTKNFSLFGEDAKQTTSDIIDAKNEFNGMTGIGITNKRLFQEIGSASKTMAYFNGNSTEELAKSALEAFKLGTNLKQAEQISTGLLNFEDSIRKELEAEVLLGKDLNFEKARGLALAGDDVEAAKEVLTQTKELLKGRKLNRIELKALAEATGLSTDELLMQQKLMTINDKLTKNQRAELEKIIDKEKERGRELSTQERIELARKAAMGMTYEQLEKNKTLQESFNAAITKLQETLVGLVEGGIVDTLVEAIESFAEFIEVFVAGQKEEKSEEAAKEIKQRKNLTEEERAYIEELEEASQDQKGFFESFGEGLVKYSNMGLGVSGFDVSGQMEAFFDADNVRAEQAAAELKRIQAGGQILDPEKRLKSEEEIRVELYMDSTKVASVTQSGTKQ